MNSVEVTARKQQERETLRNVIAQWNANRLDLFELSEPNEDLEFHGVMRFYFQDSGQKVATKCIRVASDATTQAVIETLIEKFRADMRMLSLPEYALYEIHENGDERRLGMDEKPLLVQLNWHMDDREGRFLLRRIDDTTIVPAVGFTQDCGSSFRRKLSKREKKQLKKIEKQNKAKSPSTPNGNDSGVAEKLYTELPETSFTRSISNPEAVMRRRRQQKLERKLQQFRSKDGGPDTGGTLKIYGESLCRDVPYKTLLLSVRDTAQQVVKEMLAKYGLEKEVDPHNFCLVQVNTSASADNGETKEYHGGSNNREYILDDDECPLAILMNHPSSRGSIMFHVRRRPADYHPRKRKKKPQQKWNNKPSDSLDYRYEDSLDRLPYFLELNPDGTDVNGTPKRHRLHPNVTEVGSERSTNSHGQQSQSLQLFGFNVQPRHCVIANTEGIVTVTPCSGNAETYVNGHRIYETTILQNGVVVKFGRIHSFRFIDPSVEERSRQRYDSARQVHEYNTYERQSSREDIVPIGSPTSVPNSNSINTNSPSNGGPNSSSQNYETTFDVDGNVETVSTSSLGNKEETRSRRSVSSSRDGNRFSNYERYPRGTDPILPAVLEFREETEEAFLRAVITDLDISVTHFKLAPTYTLYLVARYRASTHYAHELTPTERAHRLTALLTRVANLIHGVIQAKYSDAKFLAFWMANSSELLHFLKSDRHISAFSLETQDILSDCVQIAFRNLVSSLQGEVVSVMPSFMSEEDDGPENDNTCPVLQLLSSTMGILRRCRVNAALTIQLFSQLFHFINMWAFNTVVTSYSTSHNLCYCTRAWGLRLKSRLAHLEAWAERQGLELAADCHLAKIIQAAHLLQAPKYNADDLANLSSTCFKLNSLQLRALLTKYQPAPDEPRIPQELIENVVRAAENVADELARSDGREIHLEEAAELKLPFLLPEDGYSCDVVRGVPQGLAEFLLPLQQAGLCRMTVQPTSSGLWTIYLNQDHNAMARSPSAMSNRSGGGFRPAQPEPEIQVITLNKSNNGMGLSIVAAKGAGQDRLGIYIKSVVKGGAADVDGQLEAGDQLLKVDGQSLVGITQEKAAELLVRTGNPVTLHVAKQGAIYQGLATLLQQPSPIIGKGRHHSERDLSSGMQGKPGILGDHRQNMPTIQSSKSVPSLNNTGDMLHSPTIPSSGIASGNKHEVFNPGYSRTSSTNSIPQKTYEGGPPASVLTPATGLRSKSSQNLNDMRLPLTGLGSRQSSNPSLHPPAHGHVQGHLYSKPSANHPPNTAPPTHVMYKHGNTGVQHYSQQGVEGERFYQNLSVYRNQDTYNNYSAAGQEKAPSPQNVNERPPTQQSQKPFCGSQSSLHRPQEVMLHDRDRPVSAYIPPIENTLQKQGALPRAQSARDIIRQDAKFIEMQEEVQRKKMEGIGSPVHQYVLAPAYPRMQGGPGLLQRGVQGYAGHRPPGLQGHQGLVCRPQPPQMIHHVPVDHGHSNPRSHGPPFSPSGRPPVPASASSLNPAVFSQPHYAPAPAATNRQSFQPGYWESPPPPPPPTSTHPLYQTGQRMMMHPPGYTDEANRLSGSRPFHYDVANPWEREEKEKEQQRRLEAARLYRDQLIFELINKQNRTPKEEEQLQALKLERDFQRRAEEDAAAGCDDEEEGDDQEQVETSASLTQPLQPAEHHVHGDTYPATGTGAYSALQPGRPTHVEGAVDDAEHKRTKDDHEIDSRRDDGLKQQQKMSSIPVQGNRQPTNISQNYSPNHHSIMTGKPAVCATSSNLHTSVPAAHYSSPSVPRAEMGPLRLDNLITNESSPVGNNTNHQRGSYQHNYNGYLTVQSSTGFQNNSPYYQEAGTGSNYYASPGGSHTNNQANPQSGSQRLDSLLLSDISDLPPQPPERGSSFSVMYQSRGMSSNATLPGPNRIPEPVADNSSYIAETTSGIKKVSFHESYTSQPQSPVMQSSSFDQTIEDPNTFINETQNILASRSPDGSGFGNTPGVIGAQEVYKDPRARMLAQQHQQRSTRTTPLPEKLSFKEKMKMFAMTTGEDGTPRDKVKISRAQRNIDNLNSPSHASNAVTNSSSTNNDTNGNENGHYNESNCNNNSNKNSNKSN
ncbi:afadin isoform X2 [Bacillus rossius redtenbacheri]|uniref:afadin isoform X2 n=1 Tax=Bacillus rossius redtenbacheri TaxID=93214 RepID=UPI002FDDEC4A